MSYQSTIAIPDALDAMEKNIRLIITIAGYIPRNVAVMSDTASGTASIHHSMSGREIDCMVRFPALPAEYRLGRAEMDRWTGYFIHEICHALYTDDHAWRLACNEGLSALVNGMEDVRIERKLNRAAVASNSVERLNELMAWAVAQAADQSDPNARRNLPWTLASIGRAEVCGYDLPALAPTLARVSPAMRKTLDGAFAGIRKAKDTMDILRIARAIVGRDPETGAKPQPTTAEGADVSTRKAPSDQGDQGEGDQGETDQGEGDQGDQGGSAATADDGSDDVAETGKGDQGEGDQGEGDQGEGDQGETGKGEAGKGDQGEGEGDQGETVKGAAGNGMGSGGNGVSAVDDATEMQPFDFDLMSDETKAEIANLAKDHRTRQIEARAVDMIRRANAMAGRALGTYAQGASSPVEVVAQANKCGKLRQQVARVIRATETETWTRNTAAGRINRFALARIGAGTVENVYAKRSIAEGYETEIVVLCDGSGSMGSDEKLRCVATLALVVAQACQQVGAKCQVVQFATGNRLFEVKPTKSSASATLGMFGRLARSVGGGTPLAESILAMSTRLAGRAPTKRKMIFAITDGEDDNGPQTVRKACEHATRLGVEVIGLTIDAPAHPGFTMQANVSSRGKIEEAGLGVLVRALERCAT